MAWAAWLFFIPLLFACERFRSRPLLAAIETGLCGVALGAYAYLGAYAEGWVLYALAILLCASLFGACGYLSSRLFLKRQRFWILLCPLLWAAGERIVNLLGLPFELALTLDDALMPLQLASLGGPWLVTIFLLFVQTARLFIFKVRFIVATGTSNGLRFYSRAHCFNYVSVRFQQNFSAGRNEYHTANRFCRPNQLIVHAAAA